MATVNEKMTGLADAIRGKSGVTGLLSIDEMTAAVQGIATGGGGDPSAEDALVSGEGFTTYTNDRVESIRAYCFEGCQDLTSVHFANCRAINSSAFTACGSLSTVSIPQCQTISDWGFAECGMLGSIDLPECIDIYEMAFSACGNLTSISLPACEYIGPGVFNYCVGLSSMFLPSCTWIEQYAFIGCNSLTNITFESIEHIGYGVFSECTRLEKIVLSNPDTVCELEDIEAFAGTGITQTTGIIQVPSNLVSSYKTATNWSYFKNRIFPIT